MAALRAAELGLSTLIIEKAHKYGGTSASSGGVLWIPNHGLADNGDSREQAMRYLDGLVSGPIQRERLEAFVDHGPIHAIARDRSAAGTMARLLP
jgi:3-oxosteroid 1-dehydrogenase